MAIIRPMNLPFGACEILPLAGFPKGRAKIRIRYDDFVRVYIKTESGIEAYHVKEVGGFWEPLSLISENKTV